MENRYFKLKDQNGGVLCEKAAVASNIFARMKGLMFSENMPEGCDGLIITPCNSIHTFFMLFSLDVLFLDKDFRIVKVVYDIRPWRMSWLYFKAQKVVEMKAGTLRRDLKIGDKLEAICIN